MNESELQSRLELLIGEGAFLKSITNRDAPTKALKHSMSNSLLPPFPTDYLSRLRVAEAADYVLECCGKLECVATNRNNISRTKGELLFSDLLYCNTEYGVLFLFELKRGTQTPRQTVTELLAYEHEVLNYLPFTSPFHSLGRH